MTRIRDKKLIMRHKRDQVKERARDQELEVKIRNDDYKDENKENRDKLRTQI